MAVTDQARKILWGRSGNRCAICRRRLVEAGTAPDGDAVVGDECHIVAQSPLGPRGGTPPADDLDRYDNLILLCAADHRMVDAQPETYPAAVLQAQKRDDERWVEQTLEIKVKPAPGAAKPIFVRLAPVDTGKELLDIVAGSFGLQFDHPEPQDETEAEAIADLFQEVQDWRDIYDEIPAGGRVRAAYHLTSKIRELAAHGLFLWCGKARAAFGSIKPPLVGWLVVILVRRDSKTTTATSGQVLAVVPPQVAPTPPGQPERSV